jgi:hypothetical protein
MAKTFEMTLVRRLANPVVTILLRAGAKIGPTVLLGGEFGQLSQWLDSTADSPYACFSRKLSMLPISNSEDDDGPSRVLVPARGLPPQLFGEALASLLVSSSAFLLTRKGQAQHAPPAPLAPLPRRLPRLLSRLHCLVGWRVSASASASLARGQKPPRSPQTHKHRRFRLSQPAVPVLRHHRRFHPCSGWGWHTWLR